MALWRLAACLQAALAWQSLEDLRTDARDDWEEVSHAVPTEGHELDVIFAVKHSSAAALDAALAKVAEPKSPGYGRYWALDDGFAQLLGARDRHRALLAALQWPRLEATKAGDFLRGRLGVAELLAAGVGLRPWRHKASGELRFALAPKEPLVLPDSVAEHVDFVSGLHLPRARRRLAGVAKRPTAPGEAGNASEVLVVEARDRGFQVHIAVHLARPRYRSLCPSGGASCALQEFSTRCTPTRMAGRVEYLKPIHLRGAVIEDACSVEEDANGVQITCVVVLGPALGLVNFLPTELQVQTVFVDGTAGEWVAYERMAFPSLSMTVSDLRRMYNVPDGFRNTFAKNSQAIASFFNISASEADAKLFHLAMGTRPQPAVHFVGGRTDPGVEGNIDLQWIQAMGNKVPVTYWATPGGSQATAHETPFLEWILALANSSDPPLIHSLSYGENEEAYSLAYQQRGNLELAKLGLRGVTVLAATGDTGVQGAAQQGGAPTRCAPFAAVWPASSPYITAVGATMVSTHVSEVCNIDRVYAMGSNSSMPFNCPETNVGEIVCSTQSGSMITGGGGFSGRFPRPSWQAAAVEEYLGQISVNQSLFNSSGRAYPDLSAVGANVPIFFEGRLTMVGGTSASSPIVAGLVALLNGERLKAGKPSLGFLNPLLYESYDRWPDVVHDVRVGNISGTNLLLPTDLLTDCAEGFPAKPGWDAASGLGSPNFYEMLQHMVPASQRGSGAFVELGLVVQKVDGLQEDEKAATTVAVAQARKKKIQIILQLIPAPDVAGLFNIEKHPAGKPLTGAKLGPPLDTVKRDHVCLVLHTSGTTKKPKIVPITHESMAIGGMCHAAANLLGPEDVFVNTMPMFHIAGLMENLLMSAYSGCKFVALPGQYQAHSFFQAMQKEPLPTCYSAVPAHHMSLMSLAKEAKSFESPLRVIRNDSAALLPSLAEQMEEFFNATVLPAYSMTEANPLCSNPRHGVRKLKSVGPAVGPGPIATRLARVGRPGSLAQQQARRPLGAGLGKEYVGF
ncbi:unnamed protein product [Effrenium voratum]|nr:unnamed protein product [Effrenium voratum]